MARSRAAANAADNDPEQATVTAADAEEPAEEEGAPEAAEVPATPRKPWLISANYRGEVGGEA